MWSDHFKESDRLYMVVELIMLFCADKFFRIHLRQIKLFYNVYLLSLITKPTFKIIFLGGNILRIFFFQLLNNDDKKYNLSINQC